MREALQLAWLRRGALAWSLWPLSLVFGALAALRRGLYRLRLLSRETVPVPVLVVGNVLAGGSGKTPVVMAVVDHLKGRGLKVGVVSRGYGRRATDCREVLAGATAAEVGDEPLLVAASCRVPVFVAARRIEAARALLKAYPRTQVIVCDDGLQHLALARDIEICVFDDRGLGNGWLLPAGPLREPWPRRVDLVLHTGGDPRVRGFTLRRGLAPYAMRGDGTRTALASLVGQPLKAVAGIAKPQAFFDMLRAQGLTLARTVALPDHHDFSRGPSLPTESLPLICTEKDAVKLWRSHPQAWAVPLALQFDDGFWPALDALLDARLSSAPHGSQTA